MKKKIPIFPLKLVLFPDSRYPLHIFEERYKKMINRCIDNRETFGVVASIDSNFSKVGCSAKIEEILRSNQDGSFDILVSGIERILIRSTILNKDGYLEAEFSEYTDTTPNIFDESLYQDTLDKLLKVLKIAKLELENEFWANLTIAEVKSYKLAEKAGMNLKQRQKILTFKSEYDRLNYLKKHLIKIEGLISKDMQVQELIAGDGYTNK
ncbi:LON peptidase substrate-binding domain-containing protein [Bacteroidota bacterium]